MKISMIPNNQVKLIHASKGDTSLRKWNFEPYDSSGKISVADIKDQPVYYTENGGTEQLLPVNTSTPATSYFDGTINYGTDTDVEFTYKQSDYTGKARVKSIKGNTLVWNQLVNGMVTSTSDGITTAYNSSTNVITITNNNRTSNYSTGSTRGNIKTITITSGHKYLFCIDTVVPGVIVAHDTGSGLNDIPFNSVYTANSSTGNFRLRVTKDYDFVTAHPIDSVVSIKIMCIDLTILNDSHITDYNSFKQYFPLNYYAYNSGSLLNFNGSGIKTTGKNLWTPYSAQTQGGITMTVNSDGTYTLNGTATANAFFSISNANLPSAKYYISLFNEQTSSYVHMACQSADNSYPFDATMSTVNRKINATFDAKVLIIWVNSGTTLNNFVVKPYIGLVDTDEFEPYTSSTTSLPISTYFPTGMKSAGSAYDELTPTKAITRVGAVDLGSLTYIKEGATTAHPDFPLFYAPVPNALGKYSANGNTQICAKYQNRDSTSLWKDMQIGFGSSSTNINIADSSFANYTVDQVKSALSGVYLNYELATYTEQDIKTASLVCKNIDTPCYLSNGELVCDATEDLTSESGFFDAKLKLKDSSSVAYSSKFKLHVEDL